MRRNELLNVVDRLARVFFPSVGLKRALRAVSPVEVANAFPVIARAAGRGNSLAQLRVGQAYLSGYGVPRSRAAAGEWLQRAAEAGLLEAQVVFANFLLEGRLSPATEPLGSGRESTDPDFEGALRWGLVAANRNSASGAALVAYVLTNGPEAVRDIVQSDNWYRRAADGDSPQGWLGHGMALMREARSEEDKAAGAAVILKAAEAGLPLALYFMGTMTQQGLGIPANEADAMNWYRQAAAAGVRAAQARWGAALLSGRGVQRNIVEGESWLRRAALAGDVDAAAMIGDLYAGGHGLPNPAEASAWYTRAAEGGHAAAARALGMLRMGGLDKDPDEAARWMRQGGDGGDETARSALSDLVLAGRGTPDDRMRVRAWFQEAADRGDPVAAFNLAVCLFEAVGGERDEREAAIWMIRAAEHVPAAQFWHGRMLLEGRLMACDPVMARSWISKAAEAGITDAEVTLGQMMVNGTGGPRDHTRALRLFEVAAAKGHAGAEFAVGALFGGGHDVPVDRKLAQARFQKAADMGHPHAQLILGRYLAQGLAGEQDIPAARIWLEKARDAGLVEAEVDLALIVEKPETLSSTQ